MDNKPIVGKRYRLEAELGRGGMGAVYLAVDRLSGERVALKRVSASAERLHLDTRGGGADLRMAMTREFQTLSILRHPYVIGVRDYGFDEQREPFFTMEYLPDSQTFFEATAGAGISKKLDLLVQLLQALAYIHRQGVVHRDLKPSNVLVSGGQVKVLDFGLAALDGLASGISGALAYMAPEVLEGAPASVASDLYSVGVMAYELFAGHHPFAADDLSGLLDAIFELEPDFSCCEIPLGMTAILRCLLSKAPGLRYPDARAVIRAMRELLDLPVVEETEEIRDSYLQAAAFVGREVELEQLSLALVAARKGMGSAWLIGGENGVGKSRLLRELRTRALVEGIPVLVGASIASGWLPYHMWRPIARWLALLAEPNDQEAGVLKLLVPDIEEILERPVAALPLLDPQAVQMQLRGVMTVLLRRALERGPLMIVLEDLHWIGDNGLALLNLVSRLAPKYPLLVVGSYRSDEAPQMPELLPEMQRLHLGRLSPAAMAALCSTMLGEAGRQPEMLSFLQRETEGNAFFLVEVVRALAVEAGRLDQVQSATLPVKVFAGGVAEVVQRRLKSAPAWAEGLLRLAAVAGRQVDPALLAAAAPGDDVERWLTVCAHRAIVEFQESSWQFVHEKLREGILAAVLPEEQRALHGRIGTAIEKLYADQLPVRALELAYHFGAAGDVERECRYALFTGLQAAAQYSNQYALDYLGRALELMPESDREGRYTVWLARARVYALLGKRPEQQQDLEALALLLADWGDDGQRAALYMEQAGVAERTGDYAGAMALLDRAIALMPGRETILLQARAHLRYGHLLYRQGNYELSRARFLLVLGVGADSLSIEADVARGLGIVCWLQGRYAECREWVERALAIFQQLGDRRGVAGTLNELGRLNLDLFYYEAGRDYFSQALQGYRDVGDRTGENIVLGNLGNVYLALGQYEQARECYEEALAIRRELRSVQHEGLALVTLARLFHHQGDYAAAERSSGEGLAVAQRTEDLWLQGWAWTNRGYALEGLERWGEAGTAYVQALEIRRKLGEPNLAAEPLAGLARLALAQGQIEPALGYVEEILSYLQGGGSLDGADDPLWVELSLYQVLQSVGDCRAGEILTRAYRELWMQAARIEDEAVQRSFLERVTVNRELKRLYEQERKEDLF